MKRVLRGAYGKRVCGELWRCFAPLRVVFFFHLQNTAERWKMWKFKYLSSNLITRNSLPGHTWVPSAAIIGKLTRNGNAQSIQEILINWVASDVRKGGNTCQARWRCHEVVRWHRQGWGARWCFGWWCWNEFRGCFKRHFPEIAFALILRIAMFDDTVDDPLQAVRATMNGFFLGTLHQPTRAFLRVYFVFLRLAEGEASLARLAMETEN